MNTKIKELFESMSELQRKKEADEKAKYDKCIEILETISPITLAKYKKLVDKETELYKEQRAFYSQVNKVYFALQSEEFKLAVKELRLDGLHPEQGVLNDWLKTKGIERIQ
jgi:hypothetical protein